MCGAGEDRRAQLPVGGGQRCSPTRGRIANVAWKAKLLITKDRTEGSARMAPATIVVRTSCEAMMPYT